MRLFSLIFLSTLLMGCATMNSSTNEGTTNWESVGADIWYTSDGTLSTSQAEGKSYLVSPNTYENFTIELEFRPDAIVNSGVFINCENNTEIGSKTCFEANISDNHEKPEYRTGSIVRHVAPGENISSIGKWNTLAMTSANGKITLEINGVITAETDASTHPSGYIGLQRFKDGVIQFKNIKITAL